MSESWTLENVLLGTLETPAEGRQIATRQLQHSGSGQIQVWLPSSSALDRSAGRSSPNVQRAYIAISWHDSISQNQGLPLPNQYARLVRSSSTGMVLTEVVVQESDRLRGIATPSCMHICLGLNIL